MSGLAIHHGLAFGRGEPTDVSGHPAVAEVCELWARVEAAWAEAHAANRADPDSPEAWARWDLAHALSAASGPLLKACEAVLKATGASRPCWTGRGWKLEVSGTAGEGLLLTREREQP